MSETRTQPITKEQIVEALKGVGVQNGDILLVYTFLGAFGRFEHKLETVVKAFQETVGPEGTLVFPTYTVKFLAGQDYDHDLTPSEAGVLTEYFRTLPDVGRTFQPVYSHAIWGNKKDEYLAVGGRETLGRESLFGRLHLDNALNVNFGTSMNRGGTFLHYFERTVEVPYRYLKTFRGNAVKDGRTTNVEVDHYARNLDAPVELNFDRFEDRIIEKGLARVAQLGRGMLFGIRLRDFYNEADLAYQEDPFYFVRKPVDLEGAKKELDE